MSIFLLAVAANLTGIHSAIKMLHSRIKVLHHYLLAMEKGTGVSCLAKLAFNDDKLFVVYPRFIKNIV